MCSALPYVPSVSVVQGVCVTAIAEGKTGCGYHNGNTGCADGLLCQTDDETSIALMLPNPPGTEPWFGVCVAVSAAWPAWPAWAVGPTSLAAGGNPAPGGSPSHARAHLLLAPTLAPTQCINDELFGCLSDADCCANPDNGGEFTCQFPTGAGPYFGFGSCKRR